VNRPVAVLQFITKRSFLFRLAWCTVAHMAMALCKLARENT
jgi:hypothetical protein